MSNGRRCIGKRRKGGSGLAFNPQPTDYFFLKKNRIPWINPSKNTFLAPCVRLKFFWSGTWMGKRRCCTAVPGGQRGGMSRAPFSVPPPCNQFHTLPTFCLLLPFQCRQARAQYPKAPHQAGLRGPGSCSFWSGPLHTCTILFVCLSFMPPHFVPCLLTPYFFFPAPPYPPTPLLG